MRVVWCIRSSLLLKFVVSRSRRQLCSQRSSQVQDGRDLSGAKFEDKAVIRLRGGNRGDALVEVVQPDGAGGALPRDERRDGGWPLAGGAGELRQKLQPEVAPMLHWRRHPGGIAAVPSAVSASILRGGRAP